jgi:divalent metal cation (Fe/Co/Zn/Cd) transporter
MTEIDLDRLRRRGFVLLGTSIIWTVIVAAVALTAGVFASSVALIGLGLDSGIELFSAAIVIWQLRGVDVDRETRAIRLIGMALFASAVYLLVESVHELIGNEHPEHSVPGLVISAAALAVMPVLSFSKRRTGQSLGSRTLIADAVETLMCAYAAAIALLGGGLDTWLGWWWAVPVAGLIMAGIAIVEGVEVWGHRTMSGADGGAQG